MATIELKATAALELTLNAFRIVRKADKGKIITEDADGNTSDKAMLQLSKRILDHPAYDAILAHQHRTKQYVIARSMPAFIRKGVYLFSLDKVEEIAKELVARQDGMLPLIDAFVSVYEAAVAEAKERLGNQFNAADYPAALAVADRFQIRWNWTQFEVAAGLPGDLFQQEKMKAEAQWAEAAEKIQLALREGFKKLIAHAADVLKSAPGEKEKRFYASSVDNIKEFIDTFKYRNLTNDGELAALVAQAEKITNSVGPGEVMRGNEPLQNYVAGKFAEINTALDTLVESKGRKFSFDD